MRVRSGFSSWWCTGSGEDCFKPTCHQPDIFAHKLRLPTWFYYTIRLGPQSSGGTSKPLKFLKLSGTIMDQIHQHVVFNLCQTFCVCLLCVVLNERSFQWLVLLSGWLQRCWEMNPTTKRYSYQLWPLTSAIAAVVVVDVENKLKQDYIRWGLIKLKHLGKVHHKTLMIHSKGMSWDADATFPLIMEFLEKWNLESCISDRRVVGRS